MWDYFNNNSDHNFSNHGIYNNFCDWNINSPCNISVWIYLANMVSSVLAVHMCNSLRELCS